MNAIQSRYYILLNFELQNYPNVESRLEKYMEDQVIENFEVKKKGKCDIFGINMN